MLNFDPTPTVTEDNAENWLRSWMRPVETCPILPFSTPLALSAAGMPPTANTCARRWVSTLNAKEHSQHLAAIEMAIPESTEWP